ncbi:ABC transporter substrate-binding protein [Sutcliffiella halmapala]|uniref:ABC transporter substrate-binding protein n=1 Tax=Sutcliffiella halmapala TaxID=79882 RepID=UPI000995D7EA|nr:ABC transporter substrate-binding protein [Sutcliffiella halmapala]
MRKFQPILMILLGLMLLLSACASNTNTPATNKDEEENTTEEASEGTDRESDEKVEIEFWHSMGGNLGESIDVIAKEFSESQDTYVVNAEFQGSYEESLTKFRSIGGTTDAPAIIQTFEVGTKFMIDSGFIEPIHTFIEKDGYDVTQLEENILNYYTYDGKQYSMPFNSSTPVLIYNKDAFKEVGLDPENPPRTYSEIKDAASKLKTDERFGFSMLTYGWFFEELLATQGGMYVNNDNGRSNTATEATFNGVEGLRVFKWLDEMNQAGTFGNFGTVWDDIRAAFQTEKVAMYMDSSAGTKGIIDNADFEVGVAFIPHPDEVEPNGVIIGGASLWMSKGIAEEEQLAAWEFMKYVNSPDVQAKWHVETGYFSIHPEAYENDIVKEQWAEYPQLKVTVDQLQATKKGVATQGALISVFPESRQHIVTALEKLYQGSDPKEVLDEAVIQSNRAIEIANKTQGN